MNKKIYLCALGVCLLLGFISGWWLRVEFDSYAVSVSDLVIFVSAIVVGPIGGAVTGVGGAIGEIIAGDYLMAIITLIIGAMQGAVCGYAYKYLFKDKNILADKIISVAIAFIVSSVACFCLEWMYSMDWGVVWSAFGVKTIARLIMAVLSVLILPKIPHIFDSDRYEKDMNNG